MDAAIAEELNRFFKKIYVITLPRLKARQEVLAVALRGLNYRLFYGQDTEKLSMDELVATGVYSPQLAAAQVPSYVPTFPSVMRLAEVAVSLSHRNVYQDALADGDFPILVLEDDAAPYPAVSAEEVSTALQQLPPDWELCYLGYEKHERTSPWAPILEVFRNTKRHLRLTKRLPREIKKQYVRPFSTHLMQAGVHLGAHAYGLSEAACRRVYEKQQPVCLVADHLLQEMVAVEDMLAFVCKPKIFMNKSFLGVEPSLLA